MRHCMDHVRFIMHCSNHYCEGPLLSLSPVQIATLWRTLRQASSILYSYASPSHFASRVVMHSCIKHLAPSLMYSMVLDTPAKRWCNVAKRLSHMHQHFHHHASQKVAETPVLVGRLHLHQNLARQARHEGPFLRHRQLGHRVAANQRL